MEESGAKWNNHTKGQKKGGTNRAVEDFAPTLNPRVGRVRRESGKHEAGRSVHGQGRNSC